MGETLSATIREVLEGAAASGAVPGAVAVVVDRDGTQGLAAGGTTRADGAGEALEPGATFRLASMTKALASVGALQLVEQGRLGLDDAVASVVPEFGEAQVLDGFDGEQPRLRPPATPATIRQLLCHTAGHGYFFLNPDLGRYHELTGVPSVLTGLRASLGTPLMSDPGTRWEYGINTDWLGLVVEAVSGQRLDEYLAEHLFGPLGMKATTFTPTAEQRAAMMPVHMRTPDGGLAVTDIDLAGEPEWMAGGHGAAATAEDYGRFISMLLRGGTAADGTRVLGQDMVELAFSDQLGDVPYPEVIESAAPELCNPIVNLPVKQTWGLGFHLTMEDLPGMRRAGTGDWAGIFNCYYWVDRVSGVGGAFLTQVLPFFDQRCVETAVGVELAAYAELSPTS
jgi:CubicO group peptidase (beta-lactamase class C family)